MKSLEHIKSSEGIIGYSASTIAKGERNDCVVRTIASSFDLPYDDAHKFVEKVFNRKPRKGTVLTSTKLNNMSLGGQKINGKSFSKIEFETKPKLIKKNNISCVINEKITPTVGKFVKENPTGTYMIFVRGHAFTIKEGKVIGNVDDSTRLKRKIVNAYKIN